MVADINQFDVSGGFTHLGCLPSPHIGFDSLSVFAEKIPRFGSGHKDYYKKCTGFGLRIRIIRPLAYN